MKSRKPVLAAACVALLNGDVASVCKESWDMRKLRLTGVAALGTLAAAVIIGPLFAQAPVAPAGGAVRVDISGEWAATTHEDVPHRNPGAELGDYTGLPINAAPRQKAGHW